MLPFSVCMPVLGAFPGLLGVDVLAFFAADGKIPRPPRTPSTPDDGLVTAAFRFGAVSVRFVATLPLAGTLFSRDAVDVVACPAWVGGAPTLTSKDSLSGRAPSTGVPLNSGSKYWI
jgi:hypothetical protein